MEGPFAVHEAAPALTPSPRPPHPLRMHTLAPLMCPDHEDDLRRMSGKTSRCSNTTGGCRQSRRVRCSRQRQVRRQRRRHTSSCDGVDCYHRSSSLYLNGRHLDFYFAHSGSEAPNDQWSAKKTSLIKVAASNADPVARCARKPNPLGKASASLGRATRLLNGQEGVTGDWPLLRQAAVGCPRKAIDDLEPQSYLPHFEHVLRCIQHVLIFHLLRQDWEPQHQDVLRTHQDWEARRRRLCDWFAEWPGGRPPLNSTMPWNIRPSLVVLWGVCWMFYRSRGGSRQEPAGGWVPSQPVGQGNVEDQSPNMAGYTAFQQQASPTHQSPGLRDNSNPAVRSGMIGSLDHPGDASAFAPGPMAQSGDHMMRSTMTLGGTLGYGPAGTTTYSQPAADDSVQVATTDVHNAPVAASFSPASSTPSVATASQTWRGAPFSRPYPPITHQQQQALTSQPSEQDIISSAPHHPQAYHDPLAHAEPYDPAYDPAYDLASTSSSSPFPPSQHPQYPAVFGAGQASGQRIAGFGPGAHSHSSSRPLPHGRVLGSMHTGQPIGYPSPHSEASETAPSLIPVSLPETAAASPRQRHMVGPRPGVSSPSLSRTIGSASRRESAGPTEPPRNAQGQIYCDHPECASKPPTFSRKCEWTKHNDKHTRPYVCTEPGCEKIRGFTYSGGLLRHQREVHRAHGGPRAPRFCPHRDCKRSSDQGFSRRENLNEHLRRVHRGVGIEGPGSTPRPAAGTPASTLAPAPFARAPGPSATPVSITSRAPPVEAGLPTPNTLQPSRKRQRQERDPDDDDDDDEDDENDDVPPLPTPSKLVQQLRAEVARLRGELAQRDQEIRSLRDMMSSGVGGPTHGFPF